MAPFGVGDKNAPQARDLSSTPTDAVRRMRGQGLSNNQIISSLQREGYSTQQIVDAMNQAEMTPASEIPSAVPREMAQSAQPPQLPQQQSPMPQAPSFQQYPQFSQEPQQQEPQAMEPMPYDAPDAPEIDQQIEQIAEAIIDEKWEELVKHVNKIVQWKQEVEGSIRALEARFSDLKQSFDSLQKGVLQKVDEYDRNLGSVGSEMKAMEQVFKQVLPELTTNVNELSRLAKNAKAAQPKQAAKKSP